MKKNKPQYVKIDTQMEGHVGIDISCPNCGENALMDVGRVAPTNYCPACGQALDWSKVPEEIWDTYE